MGERCVRRARTALLAEAVWLAVEVDGQALQVVLADAMAEAVARRAGQVGDGAAGHPTALHGAATPHHVGRARLGRVPLPILLRRAAAHRALHLPSPDGHTTRGHATAPVRRHSHYHLAVSRCQLVARDPATSEPTVASCEPCRTKHVRYDRNGRQSHVSFRCHGGCLRRPRHHLLAAPNGHEVGT